MRHARPVIWAPMYLPMGSTFGFVSVALSYRASAAGISVTATAFLATSMLVAQWLKWLWAPIVDVTLTPRTWYAIGVTSCALGVLALASIPITHDSLPALLSVAGVVGLLASLVSMSVEAMLTATGAPTDRARTSAWFQIGNLVGGSVGGGLGLYMLETLRAPWMAGAILAAIYVMCALVVFAVPPFEPHRRSGGARAAFAGVLVDVRTLARTKGGLLATLLCFLPINTGVCGAVLTQAKVASVWHASVSDVVLVQGYGSSIANAIGCLAVIKLGKRLRPRALYIAISLAFSATAIGMALGPHTPTAYIAWLLLYSAVFGAGMASYASLVLHTIGRTSAATKYSIYSSLGNFPIWWLGLVLGRVTDLYNPTSALVAEAAIGVAAIAVFMGAERRITRTHLADELPA